MLRGCLSSFQIAAFFIVGMIVVGIVSIAIMNATPQGRQQLAAMESPAPDGAQMAPEIGQVWYVQDHAYTDAVYAMILKSGANTWPAQTTDDHPDRSFHFVQPYPCRIDRVGDAGFYHCTIDSKHQIDQGSVRTDHLMTKQQAEAFSLAR